jgi:hypothetical protein
MAATSRPSDPVVTERLRAICMALPDVSERPSHGEATWFVSGKQTFVQSWDHHHDDRNAFVCAAPPGVQAELIDTDPQRFFRPPYVGGRGWIGVYLDVPDVDWDEIAEIVREAFRTIAPSALVARLDG